MSAKPIGGHSPRVRSALDEPRITIQNRPATATFAVTQAPDDPESVHLEATFDVDDPETVLDLVLDRVLELQVDERLAIHVIPLRRPERIATTMCAGVAQPAASIGQSYPQLVNNSATGRTAS